MTSFLLNFQNINRTFSDYDLRSEPLTLSLSDTHKLNDQIIQNWVPFFGGAPASWTSDRWFLDRDLVAVATRFCQSIPIGNQRVLDAEATDLDDMVDVRNFHYLTPCLGSGSLVGQRPAANC